MYRIEVKPGEETVFRTIEELATGIRNGFITSRARIYHAASQKWLPIEFHPHYKKALDGNFTPSAPAPQPSLATMPAPAFSFPGATSAPSTPEAAPEPAAAPVPEPPITRAYPAASPRARAAHAETEHDVPAVTVAESPVLAMRAAVNRTVNTEPMPDPGPVERYSPVAVLEAPRPAPKAVPAPRPEVVLPNITYPELPPMEQAEPRAPARRSRRTGGRPLLLVGSAAVLVFGGQRFLASRAAASAESPIASEAAAPAQTSAATSTRPGTRAQPTPGPTASRARRASAQPAAVQPERREPLAPPPSRPMTPGPAFAASVPSRVVPGSPLPGSTPEPTASAPAQPSHPAPRTDSTVIAPAPAAMQLEMPALLPGDSIAPSLDEGRDSLAIKRILKAVSGRKASPASP